MALGIEGLRGVSLNPFDPLQRSASVLSGAAVAGSEFGNLGDAVFQSGRVAQIEQMVRERMSRVEREVLASYRRTKDLDQQVQAASVEAHIATSPGERAEAEAKRAKFASARQKEGTKTVVGRARLERLRIADAMIRKGESKLSGGSRREGEQLITGARNLLNAKIPVDLPKVASDKSPDLTSQLTAQVPLPKGGPKVAAPNVPGVPKAVQMFRAGIPQGAGAAQRMIWQRMKGVAKETSPLRGLDGSVDGWLDSLKTSVSNAAQSVKDLVPAHTMVGQAINTIIPGGSAPAAPAGDPDAQMRAECAAGNVNPEICTGKGFPSPGGLQLPKGQKRPDAPPAPGDEGSIFDKIPGGKVTAAIAAGLLGAKVFRII